MHKDATVEANTHRHAASMIASFDEPVAKIVVNVRMGLRRNGTIRITPEARISKRHELQL